MQIRHCKIMAPRASIVGISLLSSTLVLLFSSPTYRGQQSSPLPQRSIRVDVDLVLVNVTVTDSRNRFVQGLSKESFRVWEDKIEQEITTFGREDAPLSMGIILDRSGSMGERRPGVSGSRLESARSSAYSCLQDGLREDEYFMMEFSDSTQLVADFTNDISKLRENLLFVGAGGSTALWDAIYAGVDKLQHATHQRKALLLLTDGLENHSRYTLSELRGALRERDVRIYTVGLEEAQIDAVQQLVNLSGGRNFRSSNPCKELSAELRNQYVLGYHPTNRGSGVEWREIRVRINPAGLPKELSNLSVRTRAGYYATQP